jgi:hypothetical protein
MGRMQTDEETLGCDARRQVGADRADLPAPRALHPLAERDRGPGDV